MSNYKMGYTLIETILVIAIVFILGGITITLSIESINDYNLSLSNCYYEDKFDNVLLNLESLCTSAGIEYIEGNKELNDVYSAEIIGDNITVKFKDINNDEKIKIIYLNKEIGKNFKRAYRYLGSARCIHDDWSSLNYESLDSNKISNIIENLKNNIFKSDKIGYGSERHLFATAITPDGIITYADQLSSEFKKKYVLTGGPGFGKTDILKFIGSSGQKKGYFIEYMHDPFVPERIEHIFIPETSTCIITNNEINQANYTGIEYNLFDYTKSALSTSKKDDIKYNSDLFYELINKGISLIHNAHLLHDELESYYIKAMDFAFADNIYNKVINKLEKYE